MQGGMRAVMAAWVVCSGILLAIIAATAQSMPKDVATRVELYAIPTLTLSDQQFLTGDANGKPVTVAGEFRIAQGGGRLPVVVLMHGSSASAPISSLGCIISMRWEFRPLSSMAFRAVA